MKTDRMPNNDALIKIRHQIRIADGYRKENPNWQGISEVLSTLRKRELVLANQAQVEMFGVEIDRMKSESVGTR